MQVKEQITKHEWARVHKWFYKCPHCETIKIITGTGTIMYSPKNSRLSTDKEPKCITRQTAPGTDTGITE